MLSELGLLLHSCPIPGPGNTIVAGLREPNTFVAGLRRPLCLSKTLCPLPIFSYGSHSVLGLPIFYTMKSVVSCVGDFRLGSADFFLWESFRLGSADFFIRGSQ